MLKSESDGFTFYVFLFARFFFFSFASPINLEIKPSSPSSSGVLLQNVLPPQLSSSIDLASNDIPRPKPHSKPHLNHGERVRTQQQRHQPLYHGQPTRLETPLEEKRPADSIDKFDEFGDYEYIDEKTVRRHDEGGYRRQHNPFGPPFGHAGRPWAGPPRPHRQPGFRFPVRRGDNIRRPPIRPAASLADTFHPHPHSNLHHPPPAPGVGGFANSLLNLVGLEATSPSSGGLGPGNPGPFAGYHDFDDSSGEETNQLDSDYYADYEGGLYHTPRPPTFTDRVAKWFEGFKPPPDLFKGKRKRLPPLRRHQNRPGDQKPPRFVDYDAYDTDEHHNLIFYGDGTENAGAATGILPYQTLFCHKVHQFSEFL